jgi:hypothetical protein
MLRKTLLLIASVLPLFANTAWADICFEYGSGGGISVAKGASLPAVNACTRVTLVDQGGRAGLATGSICTAEQGSGYPLLVLEYTYTACTGPGSYFESATCRIRLLDQGDLPREKDPGQVSSCNGVYADPQTGNTGPMVGFTDSSLKAWNCTNFPNVPGADPVACFSRGRWHPSK